MILSDSEDFESADEGQDHADKTSRKSRHSSSNYSDNLEAEGDVKNASAPVATKEKPKPTVEEIDGWDDFDIDSSEPVVQPSTDKKTSDIKKSTSKPETKQTPKEKEPVESSKDTGWDDFDDWGDDNAVINNPKDSKEQPQKPPSPQDRDMKEVTEKLAATTTGGWGWGWGVDSLLSTATTGLTTITNQVSQGITTVLETGIGAPEPEELAKRMAAVDDKTPETSSDTAKLVEHTEDAKPASNSGFGFGNILKFVESTGSKVITGGLDTLETIGRKTMEILQEGDPRFVRKRALLGLDPDVPVLSKVLREAKAKAEEEDRIREEKREAKEIHYENLFDDYGGLVHLEALEMLAKQVNMRIEERLRCADKDEKQDLKETLQQITDLCELPEEDESDDEATAERYAAMTKVEVFHERLQKATQDLGVKLQFQPLIKNYEEVLEWLADPEADLKAINKKAITTLAQITALCVEIYHKTAEMMLVKQRRSTADEADALTQLTVALCQYVQETARVFAQTLDNKACFENSSEAKHYITNIYLEGGNSVSYIQDAFLLIQPIIQIGAI